MPALRPSASTAAKQRRRRIADATRALLREREASKVIVVDIADLADVSPATVYNLVGTRDEVMAAVLEDAVAEIADRVSPADPNDAIGTLAELFTTAASVLLEDPLAYRRAIGALGASGDGAWLQATVGQLVLERLVEIEHLCDGSVSLDRLADLIHMGFRGVLISWTYGQVPDDRLASAAIELALRVLSSTAGPELGPALARHLVALTKEKT